MAKVLGKFFSMIKTNFDVESKFKGFHMFGSRILPSRTEKNDADYGAWRAMFSECQDQATL